MRDWDTPAMILDLAADPEHKLGKELLRSPIDQRLTEATLAKVNRAAEGRSFGSPEELNAFVSDYIRRGLPEEGRPATPLEQAQELVYEAWKTESTTARWRLAKRALRLSPDCADAYSLLAELAEPDLWESVRLYQEAVAAGERALGPEAFLAPEGKPWWEEIARRPYLRARARLAAVLWRLGRWEEAIGHLQAVLKLNPKDHQGLRFRLLPWLVFLGEPKPVNDLLAAYPEEDAAAWRYTQALWTFQQEGASAEAALRLKLAWTRNDYVPALLLDLMPLPHEAPEYFQPGDEDEAILHILDARPIWREIDGALAWLIDTLPDELQASLKPSRKVGRNEPCPCGSGRKYKRCCLGKEIVAAARHRLDDRWREWDVDHVRAMTTPAILKRLARLGLPVSEEDVREGARVHPGAAELSEEWIAAHSFAASGHEEDFPWLAAWALWERLNLRPLPVDTAFDLIWDEHERQDSRQLPNPDNWLRAWACLKEHLWRQGVRSLKDAERALGLDLDLGAWFMEFIHGLALEAQADPAYLTNALAELRDFLKLFPASELPFPNADELVARLAYLDRVEEVGRLAKTDLKAATALYQQLMSAAQADEAESSRDR